jgi:COP9 signalosome complex subunit 7
MAGVSVRELSSGQYVQPFVIMAKSTKSAAALQQVIKQALSSPNLFVFGELLAMANIKSVRMAETKRFY